MKQTWQQGKQAPVSEKSDAEYDQNSHPFARNITDAAGRQCTVPPFWETLAMPKTTVRRRKCRSRFPCLIMKEMTRGLCDLSDNFSESLASKFNNKFNTPGSKMFYKAGISYECGSLSRSFNKHHILQKGSIVLLAEDAIGECKQFLTD